MASSRQQNENFVTLKRCHDEVFSKYFQLLAKLLKSKDPNDLQAANRLIKNMVKQVRHIVCIVGCHRGDDYHTGF